MITYLASGLGGIILVSYWYRQTISNYLVKKAITLINKTPVTTNKHSSDSSFVLSANKKSACLSFMHDGKLEMVMVPFDRRLVPRMINSKVTAVYEDGTTMEITQKPGIPLLISAAHLGAKHITVENLETNEVTICDDVPKI